MLEENACVYAFLNRFTGAAIAVEDGAALATALDKVQSKDNLLQALKIFEKVRVERSSQMQDASLLNGKIWHYADGPEQAARDEAMRPEVEGRHFLHSPNQWSDPVTQAWCYGYDADTAIDEAFDKLNTKLVNGHSLTNGHR